MRGGAKKPKSEKVKKAITKHTEATQKHTEAKKEHKEAKKSTSKSPENLKIAELAEKSASAKKKETGANLVKVKAEDSAEDSRRLLDTIDLQVCGNNHQ